MSTVTQGGLDIQGNSWASYGDVVKADSEFLFIDENKGNRRRTLELVLSQTEFDEDDIPAFAKKCLMVPVGLREEISSIDDTGKVVDVKGFEDVYYYFLDGTPFGHGYRHYTVDPINGTRTNMHPRLIFNRDMGKIHDFGHPISAMLRRISYVGHDYVTRGLLNHDLHKSESPHLEFKNIEIPNPDDYLHHHDVFSAKIQIQFPKDGPDRRLRNLNFMVSNSTITLGSKINQTFLRVVNPISLILVEEIPGEDGSVEGYEDVYFYYPLGEPMVHAHRSFFRDSEKSEVRNYKSSDFNLDYDFQKLFRYSPELTEVVNARTFPHRLREHPVIYSLSEGKIHELTALLCQDKDLLVA